MTTNKYRHLYAILMYKIQTIIIYLPRIVKFYSTSFYISGIDP